MTARALLSALVAVFLSTMPDARAATVVTTAGPIRGTQDDGVAVFKGIPFAAPPVAELRWRPTQSVQKWQGVRDAMQFGPACVQPSRAPNRSRSDGLGAAPATQSEDCLTLNVWSASLTAKAPVMVWIHGGAHRFGASSLPFYDGEQLARQGVVLVSINYRLGLFGYFAHPALSRAAGDEALANYGLMDQLAALRGVRENIATFGGDASNVTVFGESAGGASVLYLVATTAAQGLFDKAIVESGGGWQRTSTLEDEEREGLRATQSVGLSPDATVEQLRELTPEQLNAAIEVAPLLNFGPSMDGQLLKVTPARAFQQGTAIDVPLLIGWNSNEASLLEVSGAPPAAVLSAFGTAEQARLRTIYADATNEVALSHAIFADSSFGAPARWIAERAASGAPSFLYHFDYTLQARRDAPGANHAAEIPYVFRTLDSIPALRPLIADADRRMASTVSECWVAFAKSGRPGCAGTPSWPTYDATRDELMHFGRTTTRVQKRFRKTPLDYQIELASKRLGVTQ